MVYLYNTIVLGCKKKKKEEEEESFTRFNNMDGPGEHYAK